MKPGEISKPITKLNKIYFSKVDRKKEQLKIEII